MTNDERQYVRALLAAYLALKDAPSKPRPFDRALALRLCRESVPIAIVMGAIDLVSARRTRRPSYASPLGPIRSLAYFRPAIDELLASPPQPGYLRYLHSAAPSCPDSRVSS